MPVYSDLEKAYRALRAKGGPYARLWAYYDGDHPLMYSTERLRKVFRNIDARFVENWCAVVIDSVTDRLDLTSVAVADNEDASKVLTDLWKSTELDLDEEDVHRGALVTGESFVMAWKNDKDQHVEAYYVDPALMHIHYDPENPREKLWAAKWWQEENGFWRLNLYYPDRFERYRTSKTGVPESHKGFVKLDEELQPNDMGQIPVFHFRRERRACLSELGNVIPPQAAINKLLSDMMISAEFGAFMQRYIISNTDQDLSKVIKNIPGAVWQIPTGEGGGQGASVGALPATSLKNFLDAIDNLVGAVGAISRTPHHYFFSKGGTPSGEALIALEAPLNKKCQSYIKRFSSVWSQVAAFLLKLSGKEVDENSITIEFAKPETVQPKTQAEIRQLGTTAGIPLVTTLRQEGWSVKQLEEMEQDKADETARQQNSLAEALMTQQRQFDQEE